MQLQHQKSNIYAKLENLNPTGSIKYRMAKHMLLQAIKQQKIKRGDTIIEATTGNTGIAFAYLAEKYGFKMIAVMPENQTAERITLIKNYNAKIILTPAKSGPMGAIIKRNQLLKKIAIAWTPDQFNNQENVKAHELGIGRELITQLTKQKVTPDYIVHGVGTGGTLMGIAKTLKTDYPNVKIIAVEPEESAVLSGGKVGEHNIQGIGEGFIPSLVDTSIIDKIVTVHTNEAVKMVQYGLKNWNLSMGISSGANIVAIEKLSKLNDLKNKNVITIIADGIERYLSVISAEFLVLSKK